MPMSPPCNMHRWAKKMTLLTLDRSITLSDLFPSFFILALNRTSIRSNLSREGQWHTFYQSSTASQTPTPSNRTKLFTWKNLIAQEISNHFKQNLKSTAIKNKTREFSIVSHEAIGSGWGNVSVWNSFSVKETHLKAQTMTWLRHSAEAFLLTCWFVEK